MSTAEQQTHTIDPVFDTESKILILGSFPSVKSREVGFFYGHPHNRFWPVLGTLFGVPAFLDGTASIAEKKCFLHENHIALWDVIESCKICGSSDASITDVRANDIYDLLQKTKIRMIYCNGATAGKLYDRYIDLDLVTKGAKIKAVCLPSTSPANAAFSKEELVSAWERIRTALKRTTYNEPYYSLNAFLKDTYARKLYKLSLNGGFSCPNRDGRVGTGGCTFCDGGSGDFAGDRGRTGQISSITEQLAYQKKLISGKFRGKETGKPSYIAYFQSYTGTYAAPERLKSLYLEALSDPEVAVLSIATRPDCLGDDVVAVLAEMNEVKPVWIELGLQTIHDRTAQAFNRGYERKVYEKAIRALHKAGISQIITHMIIGLPQETQEEIVATAEYIGRTGASGIKLQLLHVQEGTKLAEDYRAEKFETLDMQTYLQILKNCLAVIPEDIVVHRLTGDPNKAKLVAPLWSADKKRVLNAIKDYLR